MAANGNTSFPNNSIAITIHANGACVAPAKTATNPKPVNIDKGKGIHIDKAFPSNAPIKNNSQQ